MTDTFDQFFHSAEPARDKYLARLFGFFSEAVVRAWCACPAATYVDLGRPTLCEPGQTRGHTIDFTLRHRDSDKRYVAELKCELEYEGYRYLCLTNADQLRHHTSLAFGKFLRLASDPTALIVRRGGQPENVDGAILVWGAVSPEGRTAAMTEHGLADVLSVETMLTDLQTWAPAEWTTFLDRYESWTGELFGFMGRTHRRSAPLDDEPGPR